MNRIGSDGIYELLKSAAAMKLQPWHEHRADRASCYIWAAGLTISIADTDASSLYADADLRIVSREPDDAERQRIMRLIDYPRLCTKTVISKHLGLTVPQLKKLLDGWGYEHACRDRMYPNRYEQLVIVKTALLSAGRSGVTARIPVRQETACERFEKLWMFKDAGGRSFSCPLMPGCGVSG